MQPDTVDPPEFVSERPMPRQPVVMWQAWKQLLFLHWEMDPAEIRRTLPPGLTVDTWHGKAWVGLVPFFMCGVRPRFCPAMPWVSDFLELNVRTYVRDAAGRPGVWFYSLDCNQPIAVAIARTIFRLPYFRAKMRAQMGPKSDFIYYDCRRAGAPATSHYEYRAQGPVHRAVVGSLEEFLVERYRLFSEKNGVLYSGEVWHRPYEISNADAPSWCPEPIRQAGFEGITQPPDHSSQSLGVDVRIFPLKRVGSR